MKVNLLGKTELWIRDLGLEGADLNEVAAVASRVLGLRREEVFVTDASEDHLTLDILGPEMDAEHIYGKRKEMLRMLSEIPGVTVSDKTTIHSEGILGFINLEEEEARRVISKSEEMVSVISDRVRRRCIVFPTGREVKKGLIKDTNSPFVKSRLEAEGYAVEIGSVLDDDQDAIRGAIREAADSGFGLIITTGGVGAESKDRTVEALTALDPDAASPYITQYHKGTGRHEKEGVRVGVGTLGQSLIVALPGPNDEVRISMEILISDINGREGKAKMADHIANSLRSKYIQHRSLDSGHRP
ncbi:MAG: competence/damage-inducible protein A [Euryarchaeota archaeon]|nr:competence/damage-inducible protein A [Euryarchaeota archaeon]